MSSILKKRTIIVHGWAYAPTMIAWVNVKNVPVYDPGYEVYNIYA